MPRRFQPQRTTITHTCGHVTVDFPYDCMTAGLLRHLRQQPCLACQPTIKVRRQCAHFEDVPRRLTMTARERRLLELQICSACKAVTQTTIS